MKERGESVERLKRVIVKLFMITKNITGALLFAFGVFVGMLAAQQGKIEGVWLCTFIALVGFLLIYAGSKTSKRVSKAICARLDPILEQHNSKQREEVDKFYKEELTKQLAKTPEQWEAEEKREREKIIKMIVTPFKYLGLFFLCMLMLPIALFIGFVGLFISPAATLILTNLVIGFLQGVFK